MSLLVRELEIVDCIPEPIASEPVGAKHWIVVSHGKWRVVDPGRTTGIPGFVLDLAKCVQRAPGLATEHLDPSLKPLAARKRQLRRFRYQIGNVTEVSKGLVFYRSPPLED
jgi:hypothetical protein